MDWRVRSTETFLSDQLTASIQGVFERADKNAKPDPGRVTIRRLNRSEYNNTIRDLVGIDFQPAEDFPDPSGCFRPLAGRQTTQ